MLKGEPTGSPFFISLLPVAGVADKKGRLNFEYAGEKYGRN
jgi:hypothetical protein